MSRIIANSDFETKQILLNIEDDRVFVNVCRSNKYMQELCKDQSLWEERLRKYYQKLVDYKKITGLKWSEYYPIVSMFSEYANLLDKIEDHKEGTLYWSYPPTPFTKLRDRIAEYLIQFDVDIIKSILTDKFYILFYPDDYDNDDIDTQLNFNDTLLIYIRILIILIKKEDPNIQEFMLKFGFSYDMNTILAAFGSPEYILNNIDIKAVRFFDQYGYVMKNTNTYEFIKYVIENNYITIPELIKFDNYHKNVISNLLINNNIKTLDYVVDFIGKDQTREVFTEMLKYRERGENSKTYVYMVSRKIEPIFENLLNPRHLDILFETIENFAIVGIKPSPSLLDELDPDDLESFSSEVIGFRKIVED